MKAIKTQNSRKQLIATFSMLLFLFAFANNSFSQQIATKPVTTNSTLFELVPFQTETEIKQSSPLPFEANTLISFSFPMIMKVELKVYDKTGKELATIVNDLKNPGNYSVDLSSANLKSGVYYYKLRIGNSTDVRKIIVA